MSQSVLHKLTAAVAKHRKRSHLSNNSVAVEILVRLLFNSVNLRRPTVPIGRYVKNANAEELMTICL